MPDWLVQALQTAGCVALMLGAGAVAALGVIWAWQKLGPDLPVDVVDKLTKR